MNPSYNQVASDLPMHCFAKLQRWLNDPETKVYKRKVLGASPTNPGGGNSKVATIIYEKDQTALSDTGMISTAFLPDPIARYVGNLARQFKGHECLLFQINVDKKAKQPSGFRELVWLYCLDFESEAAAEATK